MNLLKLGAFIAIFTPISLFAQKENNNAATATIPVKGKCDNCKKRIENAAYINGVRKAEWDKNTQELKVVYRSSKTDPSAIAKSVVNVGHDADTLIASDDNYAKLPKCCAYRDNTIHTH